jgi:hypothetical protein
VDFDPGPGTHLMTSDDCDTYICKLGPAGDFLWARQLVPFKLNMPNVVYPVPGQGVRDATNDSITAADEA